MDSKNSEITESENTSKNGSLFDELFKGAPSWSVLLEYTEDILSFFKPRSIQATDNNCFFRNSNIGRINFRFNGCDIFAISTKNESYVLRSVFNYRKFIWSIALSNG